MGTRGAWGYVLDGEPKLTYNHFDSYPDCLGEAVLEHARESDPLELVERVRAIRLVDKSGTPSKADQRRLAEFSDTSVRSGSTADWYCLLRKTQDDPEAALAAGVMIDSREFPLDSLFCEWAYVIDLDREVFEVYEGFQREPHDQGRFAKDGPDPSEPFTPTYEGEARYYPCKLVASWPLDELPASLASAGVTG